MHATRLNWAGVGISSKGVRIVIDPFINVNVELFGHPRQAFVPLDKFDDVQAVFITHLHSDHFDPKAIRSTYGSDIPVYVPHEALEETTNAGLSNVHGVAQGQAVCIGDMKITAARSVDGLGDPQCSWIVADGEKSVFHGGDTLWHGYWQQISAQYGPFAAAFLPVNAPILHEPGAPSSLEAIAMTPEQATAAAVLLETNTLIPIHFGSFHHPPTYCETPMCLERLRTSANHRGVNLSIYQPGESFVI